MTMLQAHSLTLSDLCDDVILIIADHLAHLRAEHETPLKHFSLVNRRIRDCLLPHLFKRIHIIQPVCQLIPTTLTLEHARTCKIDMFGSMWWWCSGSYVSSKDSLELFRCIQDMCGLRTLEISMMNRSVDMFATAFQENAEKEVDMFLFKHIDKLIVSRSAAFLTSHFPNMKTLVVRGEADCAMETSMNLTTELTPIHPRLLLNGPARPLLTSIDAIATWSLDEVAALVIAFPRLRYLRMRSTWSCYRASMAEIADILAAGLQELETLHLVKCSSLSINFQSFFKGRPQSCTESAYRRMMWSEFERLRVEAENATVRCAFQAIPSLKECWVGEHRIARRLKEDDDQARWLWERRPENDGDSAHDDFEGWRMRIDRHAVVVPSEIGM